jgi:hypothetical protein
MLKIRYPFLQVQEILTPHVPMEPSNKASLEKIATWSPPHWMRAHGRTTSDANDVRRVTDVLGQTLLHGIGAAPGQAKRARRTRIVAG